MDTRIKLLKAFGVLTFFIAVGCNEDDPFGGNNPKSGYVALESESLFIQESGTITLPVNLNTSINRNGVIVNYMIEPINGTLPDNLISNAKGAVTIKAGEIRGEIRLNIPKDRNEYSFRVKLTSTNDPSFTIGISDNSKAINTDIFVGFNTEIEVTIDENPDQGQILAQVASNFIEGTSFSLLMESIEGAININEATGELSVSDRLAFDWEINPVITATVGITFGGSTIERQIKIYLSDVTNLWTGSSISFVYDGGGDETLVENQDRITDNVWFARAQKFPVFNAATESKFNFGPTYPESISPEGTLWAVGNISDGIENLDFDRFPVTVGSAYKYINENGNAPLVVYLVKDDVYLNLTWIDWHRGKGQDGLPGGFSYERSTP